jgi:hypothetical protein
VARPVEAAAARVCRRARAEPLPAILARRDLAARPEPPRALQPHRLEGQALRPIADIVRAMGHRISHEGVASVLRTSRIETFDDWYGPEDGSRVRSSIASVAKAAQEGEEALKGARERLAAAPCGRSVQRTAQATAQARLANPPCPASAARGQTPILSE